MDEMVARALSFAAFKHRHHQRDEGLPYIIHPIDVMTLIVTPGGVTEPEILAAALLHDTVEDTDTTLEEIEQNFGVHVASIVDEVTDDQNLPHNVRYALQLEKVKTYSHGAKLIKLADKTSNLRDAIRQAPASWSAQRLADHYVQALRMRQALQGTNAAIEAVFDEFYDKL